MGLIKAALDAARGGLGDQWLEVIEPAQMGGATVMTRGVRKSGKKGSENVVSNGSVIHVYDNQFMLLVDGGRIVDYTASPDTITCRILLRPLCFPGSSGMRLRRPSSGLSSAETLP